jgi:hypothetical protein
MFCIYCGAPNPEDAFFCSSCGRAIGAPPNPATPTETSRQVPSNTEESSGTTTGATVQPDLLAAQAPPLAAAQYQPPFTRKSSTVLWTMAGIAACLVVVIAVTFVLRGNQTSSGPNTSASSVTPDPSPTTAPAAYSAPPAAPVADATPAPSTAPAPAPPSPAPAASQNSIVGDWTTTTFVGSHISLHFGADGQYTLTDIAGTEEGVYVFSSADGTLRRQPKAIFSHDIIVWSCQLLGNSLSCVDPDGGGHVYTRQ